MRTIKRQFPSYQCTRLQGLQTPQTLGFLAKIPSFDSSLKAAPWHVRASVSPQLHRLQQRQFYNNFLGLALQLNRFRQLPASGSRCLWLQGCLCQQQLQVFWLGAPGCGTGSLLSSFCSPGMCFSGSRAGLVPAPDENTKVSAPRLS